MQSTSSEMAFHHVTAVTIYCAYDEDGWCELRNILFSDLVWMGICLFEVCTYIRMMLSLRWVNKKYINVWSLIALEWIALLLALPCWWVISAEIAAPRRADWIKKPIEMEIYSKLGFKLNNILINSPL